MKNLSIIFTLFFFLVGCGDNKPSKHKYIKTEKGLFSYAHGYCKLGMLVNNDHINIRDENDKPITCSGYIRLTPGEVFQYDTRIN